MLHLFQTQYLVALRLQTTRTCVNKYKTPVHKNQDVNESFLFIVISNKFEHQTLFKSTNFLISFNGEIFPLEINKFFRA